ncbi:hypothetical protein HCB18_09670 [Salinispora arenicola]|nr:hypothetical protein [Salinispora arenicola]NIL62598.1 hypothetical protein [Salinispora arenicola]
MTPAVEHRLLVRRQQPDTVGQLQGCRPRRGRLSTDSDLDLGFLKVSSRCRKLSAGEVVISLDFDFR